MYELRIAAFVIASLLLHWALFDGLERLPDQQKTAKQVVMFQVTQPPPPPPPPEPPPPPVRNWLRMSRAPFREWLPRIWERSALAAPVR